MGRGLREVAADVVCTLGMEEDEGKIDALAVSLAEAANKTFGSNSDLETKLMTSLNQSSLSQSAWGRRSKYRLSQCHEQRTGK